MRARKILGVVLYSRMTPAKPRPVEISSSPTRVKGESVYKVSRIIMHTSEVKEVDGLLEQSLTDQILSFNVECII